VAQKESFLYQTVIKSDQKPFMRLDLFIEFDCKRNIRILSVDIKYSMYDL